MKDEERVLWSRYRAGDQQVLEDMLKYYIRLVRFWANEVSKIAPQVDRDDLIQEGLIVLIKVIEKFDPNRGAEFSSYARKWIREALLDYLQKQDRLTDYLYRQWRKIDQAQEALIRRLGRKPTMAEIAEAAELTEQQVERALDAMSIARPDELPDDDSGLPASSVTVENHEAVILINELMAKLSDRERWIITESFYLGRTDGEIAERGKLTSGNVKAIRRRALKKLAKLLEEAGKERL
jgi:RNA polymerase sigma factor (sigma-70 family)